jgi:hypothetical protein
MATTNDTQTPPKADESRWTDEGGSNQHFRRDDEPGEPAWKPFGPGEDRTWRKFEPTYGKRFESSVKPADEKAK